MRRMIRLIKAHVGLMIYLIIRPIRRIIDLIIRLTAQLWPIVRHKGHDASTVVALSPPTMSPDEGLC